MVMVRWMETWTGVSRFLTKDCVTSQTRDFCYKQHLQFIAHICGLENSALQKQVLFDVNTPGKVWKNIERIQESSPVDMLYFQPIQKI